ncbi:hypothetical protein ARAF_0723 [Arsenophonus endosymbiont of Aleurodicus floccissimus]|uniref:Sak single strand annealing protein n=1 Tax=Arsenophonus endosymbiont of Aleurodicus floccissimus TaxID=2152761 RepID=UPI000EE7BC00|nr:DUF1071 domain-containing protein [Arsenophonus endosymbiont of Aleurodicus floccissimus]SPP31589.1 hypothetical protein ARAF_0723 [Arsenophonus endosymbiont of Aleurodicus floccissimus]
MSEIQHTEKEKSFQQQVWETLSTINVNEKIEKKNGLSYLSWAWAWGVLMAQAHYPESYYTIDTVSYNNDGSAMVSLTLTVKQGDNEFPRKMWLPMMDYRNQAISNPNAVDINKILMRCLTKAISMFGLWFYIYAGEDLPEQEKIIIQKEIAQQKERYDQLIRDLKTAAKSGVESMKMHWQQLTPEETDIIGEENKMAIYRHIAMKNEAHHEAENERVVSGKTGESHRQQFTQGLIKWQGNNPTKLPHAVSL